MNDERDALKRAAIDALGYFVENTDCGDPRIIRLEAVVAGMRDTLADKKLKVVPRATTEALLSRCDRLTAALADRERVLQELVRAVDGLLAAPGASAPMSARINLYDALEPARAALRSKQPPSAGKP